MSVHDSSRAHPVRWLAVPLAVVLLTGCATREPAVLDFGVGASPELKRLMWPPAEDIEATRDTRDMEAVAANGTSPQPRYVYAGQLTGEENFRRARVTDETLGGSLSAALDWIVGLVAGERAQMILQRPQSGVVDEAGRILVTDTSRQAVYVFDQVAGRLDVWENAVGLTRFASPAGIALGEAGTIYVADAELGLVARLDRKGNSLGPVGRGELRRPVGVAFDAMTRRLYVADTYAHDIKVFDAEGRLLRTLGERGEAPGKFNFPTYLTLAKGRLYVTDTMNWRIQVLDAETGEPLRVIGERGLHVGNLVRPKGVAVDDEGNIYVVESYFDHLLVFNKNGEFLLPIGGTGKEIGKFFLPSGVWADAHNRIFVSDMFNGRVVLFQYLGGGAESE